MHSATITTPYLQNREGCVLFVVRSPLLSEDSISTTIIELCSTVVYCVTDATATSPYGWTLHGLKPLYSTWKGVHHP